MRFERFRDGPTATTLLASSLLALFLGLRLALARVRDPFFDELLTAWFARNVPLDRLWGVLVDDSGSLLHYGLVRLIWQVFGFSVGTGRILSILFALGTFILILRWGSLGAKRFYALALLAVYPAHFFFSTEARAYALAALFIGVASWSLDRWLDSSSRAALGGAVLALVLAGYTHPYGVLAFPLPALLAILIARQRKVIAEGLAASAAAGALFVPGFWLAYLQPAGSIRWMAIHDAGERWLLLLRSFQQLTFAAPYPPVFMLPPPLWIQLAAAALAIFIVARPHEGRAARFAVMTLAPLAAVLAFAFLGKTFYFPVRFESVFSVPLVVWLATALRTSNRWEVGAALGLILMGGVVCYRAVLDHASRPLDPYRRVAVYARQRLDPRIPIIVSGLSYLEIISQKDELWSPPVMTLPARQSAHPGWREIAPAGRLRQESRALSLRYPSAFWAGEIEGPELAVLNEVYEVRPLFRGSNLLIARLSVRSPANPGQASVHFSQLGRDAQSASDTYVHETGSARRALRVPTSFPSRGRGDVDARCATGARRAAAADRPISAPAARGL